jgi:predicted Fe-Mo cluster-binding NifX family protein
MKIIVTAEGSDLDAPASPRFGRCPTFVFVDTETLGFEAFPNPAAAASGGAGIQAAQFVVEQGAQAVLTGNLGPNAADVFRAANVPVYLNSEATVRGATKAFIAGRLEAADGATVAAHAGMRFGAGKGRGQPVAVTTGRDDEIAALKSTAADMRQQLADVIDRIEQLEKES